MTDIYYKLKSKLLCQDCKWPLVYSDDIDANTYKAICPCCGDEYEVYLEKRFIKKG